MLCLKIILAVASLKYLQDSQKEIYTGEVVNGLPDGSGIFYGLDGYKYKEIGKMENSMALESNPLLTMMSMKD